MASLVVAGLYAAYAGAAAEAGYGVAFAVAATAAQIGAAYIDSTYVYPAFTGGDGQKTYGPKVEGMPIQTASEGTGMAFSLGRTNRIAGQVIWLSPLIQLEKRKDVSGGKSGGSDSVNITYEYYYHCAIALGEGVIEDVDKIWADDKVIYDVESTPPHNNTVHFVRIHPGWEVSQYPDPIIESYLGVGKTPAFRGTAYFVLEGLYLRNFGNRLPNFTALVRKQNHETVAAGIYNIMNKAGFADQEFNVDEVDHSIRGYTYLGPSNSISALETLNLAYDVLIQEVNSQLRFFTRGREKIMSVNPLDLVSVESGKGDKAPRPFQMTDQSGFELPKEVNARYIDPTNDYQIGSVSYTRNDANRATGIKQVDLQVVMSPGEAGDFVANQLWRAYAERIKVELSLPPSYLMLCENDIITIEWEGEIYSIRLIEINRGDNFLLQMSGLLVGIADADESVDCSGRDNESTPLALPDPGSQLLVAILDTPAVRDSDTQTMGVYISATNSFIQTFNESVSVLISTDMVNWSAVDGLTPNGDMGLTRTVLADGPAGYFDDVNTVDVFMYKGNLVSVSEVQVLAGSNRMWIGDELIAFQNATLSGPGKYTLSRLLRQLRVTPSDAHTLSELCVIVSPDTVMFEPVSESLLGQTRYIKLIQPGQDVTDVPTYSRKFTGATIKQLPPCHLRAVFTSTTDMVVTWIRRTRALVQVFSAYKPLLAEAELYDVEFYTVGGVLKRTKQVSTPTVTYTIAERTTDGTTVTCLVKIYQISQPVGRGFPAKETF